jgi:ATP-binding cassette subfamily B protein
MQSRKDLTKQTLTYYWRHVWKYPRSVIGLLIAIPFTILVNTVLPPLILAHVLGQISKHQYIPHQVWHSFGPQLVAYVLLVFLGGAVCWRIVDWIGWRLEGNVERDMAREVFDHIQKQSANFHANHFGGSMVSQSSKLLGAYIRVADTTIFGVLPLLFSIVFIAIVLSFQSIVYAIIILLFSALYITLSFLVTKPVRQRGAEQAARESTQTGVLADAITNVMGIKSFAGGEFESQRFAQAASHTRNGLFSILRAHQRQQTVFSTLLSLISGGSLVMAVVGVVVYGANVATVFLILNYTASIAGQLLAFGNNHLRAYNRALGDASDMIEILGITPEVVDPLSPEKVQISHGGIAFENVTFLHDGSEEAIFDKISLRIKPGEKVGLVGHSGSGKTTLTRLLLRFSDIKDGAITIDAQNIAAITQADLRRHIAYVPQEPLLFHRSISENIAYGTPDAPRETIEAIAKMASAHEFITSLPQGYDTLVGERGVKLSGGQRQRVVIARAMLKNAPILVLDEATSALDSESEVLIQDALWKLMEGRTAIVIAHRLSTIQKMDRILVLDNGKIVEEGSHKELLRASGIYAKLWAHQSGGFIEE